VSEPPVLSVVTLMESSLHDIPAKLRELANDVEAGKFGKPGTCAVVLFADQLCVFGYGPDSAAPSVAIVLQAGVQKLAGTLVAHGS